MQGRHQGKCNGKYGNLYPGEVGAGNVHRGGAYCQRQFKRYGLRSKALLHKIDHDEADCQGGESSRDLCIGALELAKADPFNHQSERATQDNSARKGKPDWCPQCTGGDCHEATEHEGLAVSEVQFVKDAEDQGVAQGHQGIHAAKDDSVQDLFGQHACRVPPCRLDFGCAMRASSRRSERSVP